MSFGPFLLGICILEGPNQCQMKSMEKEVYPERMTIWKNDYVIYGRQVPMLDFRMQEYWSRFKSGEWRGAHLTTISAA